MLADTGRFADRQKWKDIPQDQREFQTRLMEVFAGFLEHTDAQYGRIIDELENLGIKDNTLVIYINGDNGSAPAGGNGSISELLGQNSMPTTVDDHIRVLNEEYGGLDALGGPLLEAMYHHGWAWAGSTPFKNMKLIGSHFGGTRNPMVISWPAKIKHDDKPRPQFHHVNDIAVTLYDILDITPPDFYNGVAQDRLDGVSFAYTFNDADAKGQKTTQYFEVMGSRGIYKDGWFAGTFGPRNLWNKAQSRLAGWDPNDDVWELYNINKDFSQAHDLAKQKPEKLAFMKDAFLVEAANNNVFPIGGSLYVAVYHQDEMKSSPLTQWNLYEGMTRIAESLSETFDVGMDLGSAVALDYHDKVPFKFNGTIEKLNIRYID